MDAFIIVVGMLLGFLFKKWLDYRKLCKKIALIERELNQGRKERIDLHGSL